MGIQEFFVTSIEIQESGRYRYQLEAFIISYPSAGSMSDSMLIEMRYLHFILSMDKNTSMAK